MRLCQIAADRWDEIDAHYYRPGYTILREKPHRFAGLVYTWCVERVPSDELEDWLVSLRELLSWQDSNSETAVDLESESFLAMQAKGGR